jgi:hypothetical protein
MLDKSQTFEQFKELQINVAGSEIIIINRKEKYYVITENIHILLPFPLHDRISKRLTRTNVNYSKTPTNVNYSKTTIALQQILNICSLHENLRQILVLPNTNHVKPGLHIYLLSKVYIY